MSVTIDDTSSSITYSRGWELLEGPRTLHSTWDTDCRATFSFQGTYIAVYGTIPRGGGETIVVDFAVDGERSQRVYREAGRQTINDDLWYETGALPSGDHTLTMTYYEGNRDFQLDRIVYTPAPAPPPSNSSHTVTATQFIKTSHEETTAGPSGTATVGTSSTPAPKISAPTGAIVGGVVAGLAAIVFLLLLLFLIRRRRRQMGPNQAHLGHQRGLSSEAASKGGITPFDAHKEGGREALAPPHTLVTSSKKALARSRVAYGPAGAESQAEGTENSDNVVHPAPIPSYDSSSNPTRGFPPNETFSIPFEVGHNSSPRKSSLFQDDLRSGSDLEVAPAYFPRGREQASRGSTTDVEVRESGGGDSIGASGVSHVLLPSPVDDLPPAYHHGIGT